MVTPISEVLQFKTFRTSYPFSRIDEIYAQSVEETNRAVVIQKLDSCYNFEIQNTPHIIAGYCFSRSRNLRTTSTPIDLGDWHFYFIKIIFLV